MLLIDGDIADMLLIVAAFTDLIYAASVLAGGGSSDFLVLMTQCRDDVVLEGLGGIFHALVHGIAVLSAGRSDHGLVVGVTQSRNALSVGITASRAGKGLDALLVDGRFLGHDTLIIGVRGLVGEITLVSKTRNLIALIDGIALGSAGGGNDLQDVVGLVQRRNLLSTGLTAILALEGLDAGLGVGGSFRHGAVIPAMTLGGNIVVVVVHAAPLVADMLIIALRGAGGVMMAHGEGVDGLRLLLGGSGSSRLLGRSLGAGGGFMGVVDGSLGGTILSRNIVGVRVLAGSGLLSLVGSSLRLSGLVLGAGSIGIGLALGFTLSLALGRRRAGIFLLGSVGGFGLCGACRIAQAGGRSRRGSILILLALTSGNRDCDCSSHGNCKHILHHRLFAHDFTSPFYCVG